MNLKDLKREIRALKKLKLQCRAGTPERIELHRKIKALKKQLKEIKENKIIPENPLQYKLKEIRPEPETIKEKYLDDNGCSYFSYCKRVNRDNIINNACYNPKYFIEKLARKCSQLKQED